MEHQTVDLEKLRHSLCFDELAFYARNCLKINTKEQTLEPFILNKAQKYVDAELEKQLRETGRVRAIIVKGRQLGMSTYVQARFFRKVTMNPAVKAFILTHDAVATANLFGMAFRYYKHLPELVRPHLGKSNQKELYFDNIDSGYRVGTAGTKGVGRSQTIHLFHGSEVAIWPDADEHLSGILQAVADHPRTEIILESTAHGVGGAFHGMSKNAEHNMGDFKLIFVPWFWSEEYQTPIPPDFVLTDEESDLIYQYELTKEQICWRRAKIIELSAGDEISVGEQRFKQEFPLNAAEAFQFSGGDTLITSEMCMRARKNVVEPIGSYTIGVDPSYGQGDRFAVAKRMGSRVWDVKGYKGNEVDTLTKRVAICHKLLTTVDPIAGKVPDGMFVDAAAGQSLVDFLLSHYNFQTEIRKVAFGSAPVNKNKYSNKRNEMYGWFFDAMIDEFNPLQIPDDDELQADLCATPYSYDHYERRCLKKKEAIKKEFGFSPDLADAVALTFAYQIRTTNVVDKSRWPKPTKPMGITRENSRGFGGYR